MVTYDTSKRFFMLKFNTGDTILTHSLARLFDNCSTTTTVIVNPHSCFSRLLLPSLASFPIFLLLYVNKYMKLLQNSSVEIIGELLRIIKMLKMSLGSLILIFFLIFTFT